MTDTLVLTSSLEDYLEAIYNIIQEKKAVRVKDIAQRLKVSSASVTGALRTLAKRNFLNYAPYDVITLTAEGEKLAKEIVRRHEVLRDFFVKVLAVEPGAADEAACKLEHGIPPDIVNRLVKFIEFIEICPLGGQELIKGFQRHLESGAKKDLCEQCINLVKERVHSSDESVDDVVRQIPLSKLNIGDKGMIKKIKAKGTLKKRFKEMGVTPGTVIEVERIAPIGDPIEVKLMGYHLSLRKEEASKIEVEII